MAVLGLATVGTSAIVRRALVAAAMVPGIRHVGVYSRDAAKGRALLPDRDAVVVTDLGELAASPVVDAVYVASPNALHAEQTAVLLAAGKHVLVEKSATSTAREFAELREVARRSHVVLLEAVRNGGYDPGVARVAELLPRLGPVRRVRFEYAQRSSRYDRFLAGEAVNIFDPGLSAGALMDIGVYCAHLAVELFGVPDDIVAARMTRLRGGIDGAGAVLLAYGGSGESGESGETDETGQTAGTTVELAYSKITDSHVASEIQGEEATLVVDQADNPTRLRLVDRHGAVQDIAVDKPEDNMVFEFAELHRLVETGSSPDRWNDVTEHRLRLTDAVRARTGLVFPADRHGC
jgi:predicted dehydrogenase